MLGFLGLGSNEEKPLALWEILVREAVMHIHSSEFREEFYALIRNDEIHTRLYSLHLLLIAEKLKHSKSQSKGVFPTYKLWFGYRWALFRLNSRILPLNFYQLSYAGFHSHLP